ncbi:hypothetical protein QQ045_011006 [Rhodiola kirilowii]
MHYLEAIVINVREDEGTTITTEDLDILVAIYERALIDWYGIFCQRFKAYTENRTPLYPAMIGGALITKIAMGLDLTFGHDGCKTPRKMLVNFRYEATGHSNILKKKEEEEEGDDDYESEE